MVGHFGEDMPDLTLLNIILMVAIVITSLLIILIIAKVREIENGTMKTLIYIVLGLVMFTMVAVSYNLWENPQTGDVIYAKDIVMPYIQFYPTLILALALGATVFIAYMEGDTYPYVFAGMGFAVLLPDLLEYVLSNGRYDLALLGSALWMAMPVVWAFMWKDGSRVEMTTWEKIVTSLKAAVVTYPIYLLTSLVAVFGESPRGIDSGVIASISNSIQDVVMYVLVTIWLYFIVTIIIVTLLFVAHDLIIHLLGYKRVMGKKGFIYEKIPVPVKKTAIPKINHYATLISEMQGFVKQIGEVDRIRAASTIGRFKSEYQTLAARYDEESKSDAERMIKTIELEFMQKY